MTIAEIVAHLNARVLTEAGRLQTRVDRVYAGDRISDMLEQATEGTLVVTNLAGTSLLRVAGLMDIPAICLVNGKEPEGAMLEAAQRQGTAVLVSPWDMFETCGLVYRALRGGAGP